MSGMLYSLRPWAHTVLGTVLITGVGGPAGRSAAAYVRQKGFWTIGADVRDLGIPVDVFRQLPPVADLTFSAELLALIRKERPSLFIPAVSEELPLVARLAKDISARGCAVFISSPQAVEMVQDKLLTARFFEETDVAVPRTFDEFSSRGIVLKELGIPCLSKPGNGQGDTGVAVYQSDSELFAEDRHGLIFQEFVPGQEYELNLFADLDGSVTSSVVLQKGGAGSAGAVTRVYQPDVAALGRSVVARMGLSGPLSMDIRRRADGTPVLLKINARIGDSVPAAPEILEALIDAWMMSKKTEGNGGR